MKKIIYIILMFTSTSILSQNVTVIDNNTLKGIENVIISNDTNKIITNKEGIAGIFNFENSKKISFSHSSYNTVIISYEKLKAKNFEIKLKPSIINIDEIVVSANKFEEKAEDVPRQIEIISKNDIASNNSQNTADILQQSGDIFVQKSQLGGGSPIIRGFETNKILLVVDGVRMNNAIYRGGHLQNIITVDESMLEKAEIVYGPGSVVYGSDALGGVIHMFTKKPILSLDSNIYSTGNFYTRYASSDNEQSSHFDVNLGWKKFASITSASIHVLGDLRQGANRMSEYPDFGKCEYFASFIDGKDTMIKNSDVNIQRRSGYSQYDIMQKFLYSPNNKTKHLLNFQYSTTNNISRYDRLSQYSDGILKYADWYYGPQNRILASYIFESSKSTKFYDNNRLILAYQNIEESRNDRKFGTANLNHRIEKLNIGSINLDFDKTINKNEVRYGIESQTNFVESTAQTENIFNNEKTPLDSRYPDGGSQMSTIAAYITHTLEANDKFLISDGIRFSYVNLNCKFNDKTFYNFPFDDINQKNNAVNGNLGFIFKGPKKLNISVNASSGYRAPNVDDVSKVFDSQPGIIVVPNNNLKPEYSYTGEINISKIISNKIMLKGNSYYTILNNAITTQPFLFNGSDSIMYDGTLSQVVANMNTTKAYIYGFSGKIEANITSNLSFYSSIYYTYGRLKTDSTDYPLDHIPPIYGRTGLSFEFNNFSGEFYTLYNGWKYKKDYNIFGEDNFSKATPDGTPSWYTLNLSASYRLNKYILVQAQIQNILDKNYRIFASGISAPGRNLIIALRLNF